jgi:7-carboxy-7-deazaguanine synthase
MTIDAVIEEVERYRSGLVEVTGGEPLLQPDVYPLMDRLVESGRTVLLETGGQVDVTHVPAGVIKIMDVKCPGSGESERNDWGNIERLSPDDQVKFVIKDRIDYDYARGIVARHALERRCAAVLFSPVHGVMDARELSEWILAEALPVRLQLQMHKHIWPPETRGV